MSVPHALSRALFTPQASSVLRSVVYERKQSVQFVIRPEVRKSP